MVEGRGGERDVDERGDGRGGGRGGDGREGGLCSSNISFKKPCCQVYFQQDIRAHQSCHVGNTETTMTHN